MNWEGKKVLVTGASGFKGSWICRVLLDLGAQVYGTVSHQTNPISSYNVLGLEGRLIEVNIDISNQQQVYDALNTIEPEVIIHLAAKALVPVSLRDPRRAFEVNIMGTINILEACRALKVCKRIVICSTDHVFGNVKPDEMPKKGFREIDRVSYGGPYDSSKAAMELAARSYYSIYTSEMPSIVITRCANVFGFGDVNQRRVVPAFVTSCINNNVVNVKYFNNGRQFIHITDAVCGYLKAASIDPPITEGDRPVTPTYHFALENYSDVIQQNRNFIEEHKDYIENIEKFMKFAKCDSIDDFLKGEPYIRISTLAYIIASISGGALVNHQDCIPFAPNENEIQALDCTETKKNLDWEPNKSFSKAIKDLRLWYSNLGNPVTLRRLAEGDVTHILDSLE